MKAPTEIAHPPVEVNAIDFRDAVSRLPKMKRGPVGASGKIPRDTILLPDSNGMMVETPVMSSLVATSRPWRVVVSVDARLLLDTCEKFKRIGAYKTASDVLEISLEGRSMRVKYKTTTLVIPTLS